MIYIKKINMFTLNTLTAFYRRALSVNILEYILLFSINLHFIPVSFFCKLRHGIFCTFFFYKMHCFKWRRRKVANNFIMSCDCRHTSIKLLVLSMVKGSILDVEFIFISTGERS